MTPPRETPPASKALLKAGQKHADIRSRRRDAMAELRILALADIDAGVTEVDVAAAAQVDRMTVRKWRGKQ